MRATAEPVEGNKVKLSIEVDEPEVDKVLDDTVRTLSRQVRVPGFRPGKVPRQVLEARMGGAQVLRAEALREALPDFYAKAVTEAEVDPIAAPEIDIKTGEENGPVTFEAVVEVRPTVGIPGYAGLQITVPSFAVADEEVDAQVDRLRETEAELVEVSRSAVDGDNVTIDVHGNDPKGNEVVNVDDFLYEVGSGRVVPELDEQLRGSKTGDILAFHATAPGDGGEAGPTEISFRVLVKDVKEKRLPEPTDEWAAESSEFSTIEELRADLHTRLARVKLLRTRMAIRENAMASLGELVNDEEVPAVLVDEEVQQRVHDLGHRLEEQRLSIEQFLAATGRSGDDLVAEVRQDAHRSVKADLALRALADAEALEVTEEEFATELDAMAGRLEMDAKTLREQLDRGGRTAAVRSEQRKAKALTWLVDHVELMDEAGNPVSRDELDRATAAEGEESGETSDDDSQASTGETET